MNFALFMASALIWGSTWLAITFQLGNVQPLWSLVYRFGLAALILISYCILTRHSLTFTRKQHGWIALQAVFMFFLNYILFYITASYFVSGIVATIFASIIVMNIINSRILLGNPLEIRTIYPAFLRA